MKKFFSVTQILCKRRERVIVMLSSVRIQFRSDGQHWFLPISEEKHTLPKIIWDPKLDPRTRQTCEHDNCTYQGNLSESGAMDRSHIRNTYPKEGYLSAIIWHSLQNFTYSTRKMRYRPGQVFFTYTGKGGIGLLGQNLCVNQESTSSPKRGANS